MTGPELQRRRMALGMSQHKFSLQSGVASTTLVKLESYPEAIPMQNPKRIDVMQNVVFALEELEAEMQETRRAPDRLHKSAGHNTRAMKAKRREREIFCEKLKNAKDRRYSYAAVAILAASEVRRKYLGIG